MHFFQYLDIGFCQNIFRQIGDLQRQLIQCEEIIKEIRTLTGTEAKDDKTTKKTNQITRSKDTKQKSTSVVTELKLIQEWITRQ